MYKLINGQFKSQVEYIGHKLLNTFYIFEDVIAQHSDINNIYPKCINTLRIGTYIDNYGKTHFFNTIMRFGSGENIVDNTSSGGFYVRTNMADGTLKNKGYQEFIFGGEIIIKKHPETNVIFENFKIPFFHEAHNLSLKLSKLLPNKLSGWDIAITPEGPIIVEGNDNHEFIGEGLLKYPLTKIILSEI